MPQVEVVLLPADLTARCIESRSVAVFDVLRATTSITAALAAGVEQVRIFSNVQQAADAAALHGSGILLCGETNCLPPPGFELGNSPAAFNPTAHGGRIAFLSTTNGTGAIITARAAPLLIAAALVNASAAARCLLESARDVTLLCAGTRGRVAMEDVIGAGAVADALLAAGATEIGDVARIALRLFRASRESLPQVLRDSEGGRNITAASMTTDVDFCARLDMFNVVGRILDNPLRVVR